MDEDRRSRAIRRNIDLARRYVQAGSGPETIGVVAGSEAAQSYWEARLAARGFGARQALSFHEDRPVNQAFGVLLLWRRLRERLSRAEGALVAFVFGDGTRASPWTETELGQKAAIATFVADRTLAAPRYLSVVELALRHFAPIERYLHRSGFDGLVVKWGDEIQIPTLDLSGSDPRLRDADVVRFVSERAMTSDEAEHKDWMGIGPDRAVTEFIPRRPLKRMAELADRRVIRRRGGELWGGVNLGSIAISRRFLDALVAEFDAELDDRFAARAVRPDLDPQFFTALTIARIGDARERDRAWNRAREESAAVARLHRDSPDLFSRVRRVVERFEAEIARPLQIAAVDLGEPYWGDVGQHSKIREFFMTLRERSTAGTIARALAGISNERDEWGNVIAGSSTISPDISVRDSVLLDVQLLGSGKIENSVLIGTKAGDVASSEAFDVLSIAASLTLSRGSGTYRVLAEDDCRLAAGERWTTLVTDERLTQLRVDESTDLGWDAADYRRPVLSNSMSFRDAHRTAGKQDPKVVRTRRQAIERDVWRRIRRRGGFA